MKTVITYGTFDILHRGHINLLRRARTLGDQLIVGLSSDGFNTVKHKSALLNYDNRKTVWDGYFDFLKPHVEVIYLPRTTGTSSTEIRSDIMR